MADFEHVPVLLQECIEGLAIRPDGIYLDGTVGGAGHSFEIRKRLTSGGELLCMDKDPDAQKAAQERLREFDNVTFFQNDFRDAGTVLEAYRGRINGALLDLGVSSYQLDTDERGFSYHKDGDLDMRMSGFGRSAADIVNEASFEELCQILREYGEEKMAPRIADRIIREREKQPILRTSQLAEIVLAAMPAAIRRKEKHPAKQTFQALRIAVNDELGALKEGIEGIFDLLAPGGRFCIITFHSLEDRIVKQAFADYERSCTCPPDFPVCVCGGVQKAKRISKKPILPTPEECERNHRAHSAKLRIIEKL